VIGILIFAFVLMAFVSVVKCDLTVRGRDI